VHHPILERDRAKRASRHLLAAAIAASLSGVAAGQALPNEPETADIDAFTPYASLRYTYDSNIYRLPDEAPDIGDRDDNLLTLAVGAKSKIESGQQQYEFSAEVNHTLFEAHDDLDYTGGHVLAFWKWAAPSGATGNLGYTFQRTLRDFANQNGIERLKDLRTEHRLDADGTFSLSGPFRIGVRGQFADIAFDPTNRLDLQRTLVGLNFGYASTAGSVIGLDAELVQGRYDVNPRADFDEITVGPSLEWRPTERTQVDGRIGYTKRDNKSATRADYDAATGEVAIKFNNQAGRRFTARVYRDINNLGDETAEYALITGVSVEPEWQLTGAVDLRMRAAYEQRDFQATEEATDRKDDVVAAGVFVDWNVRRNVAVTFGGDMQRRSSNRDLQDYDFARVQLQVTARF
jgi:hypothetical protein